MSFWTDIFTKNWSRNYWNHLNGRSAAQSALEPHVAALGEIYQAQRPFPGHHAVADFCIPGRRLIIELDGKEHRGKKAREKDADRDARLAKSNWITVRLTNEEVLADPAAALQKALDLADLELEN